MRERRRRELGVGRHSFGVDRLDGAVECDEITAKHIPEYDLEDNMVFSTDYPHLDVKYPHAIETFLQLPFSEQSKRKYLWDNCARLYNFA